MINFSYCCAAGERAEVEANRYNRNENKPIDWLGIDATFDERRVFDWAYLAAESRRNRNTEIAQYATYRMNEIIRK